MRVEPKASLRLVVLAACVAQACWTEECDTADCDPRIQDCSASSLCCAPTGFPAATPTPLSPMTLACATRFGGADEDVEVELTMKGGQPPYAWRVDFGDDVVDQGTHPGPSSSDATAQEFVEHTYPVSPGQDPTVYTIRATMTDARNQSQACTVAHSVDPARLRIGCDVTPRDGVVPFTVTFEARPSGCVGDCTVEWDFGDGESASGRHVTHTYTTPGTNLFRTHPARGTLTDTDGRTDYCPRPIEALPAAEPPPIPGPQATPTPMGPFPTATPTPVATATPATTATPAATATPVPTATATPVPTATPGSNQPPVITNLRVVPNEILGGGPPAQVLATVTDPDGNALTWSLVVAAGSGATGTFVPSAGAGGAVASQFAPGTTAGIANLRLTAVDSLGATTQATVSVFVFSN